MNTIATDLAVSDGTPLATHAETSAPSGYLVLIGGALDESAEILSRVVTLAGKRRNSDSPRIAILTTASEPAAAAGDAMDPEAENDENDGQYYVDLFARFGAVGVPIPIGVRLTPPYPGATYVRDQAENPDVAALIESADGVFLGGGDQTHYVLSLFRAETLGEQPFGPRRDTIALRAIRAVLDRGGVVAGTSAGLAVQQGVDMVSGGADIHHAWTHGASAGYDRSIDGIDAMTFVPAGGLGLFPEALLDSHFSEWGRPVRAIRLATETGHRCLVGVDEHTALVYSRASRRAEVIGKRGVSLLDFDGCELSPSNGSSSSDGSSGDAVLGTRWTYLVPGDRHDFASGATSRGEREAELDLPQTDSAPGCEPTSPTDLWTDDGSRPLLALAQSLLASSERTAHGTSAADRTPRYRTTLHRDERTVALSTGGFADLIISITPVPTSH